MFKNLFSPVEIGKVRIPNRLVVPAMVMNYCHGDGTATEKYVAYHEAKARGGWGLIITEDYAVDPGGKGFSNVPELWNDGQIESHSTLTKKNSRYWRENIFPDLSRRQTNQQGSHRMPAGRLEAIREGYLAGLEV